MRPDEEGTESTGYQVEHFIIGHCRMRPDEEGTERLIILLLALRPQVTAECVPMKRELKECGRWLLAENDEPSA
jgi:hypothetical protein